MSKNFEIGDLFQAAFGFTPVFDVIGGINVKILVDPPVFNPKLKPEDNLTRKSQFGTYMLTPVKFAAGNYMKYKNSGEIERVAMEDFYLPAATLIDIDRDKVVPITDQSASDGGQEEMFGFNKWRIRIRGICLYDESSKQKTIDEQEDMLLSWEEVADKINVVGPAFAKRKINAITILSFGTSQLEGRPNAIPFDISAISSTPDELTGL